MERYNRSFDTDTHRQGAASRAREHTSRGALPVRAGQLRLYAPVKSAFLAAALSISALVHATPVALPQSCAALIDGSLPQWKYNDVPPDAAKWAKEERINPNVARGDFNADGRADYAALVSVRGVPHLAFCISRGRAVKLLTVDMPYCSDVVYRSKAGKRYYNFENGRHEVLPRDGASVSCFGKSGATYIYEKGSFRRVIDSD